MVGAGDGCDWEWGEGIVGRVYFFDCLKTPPDFFILALEIPDWKLHTITPIKNFKT